MHAGRAASAYLTVACALPISGWPRGAIIDLPAHASVYVGLIAVAVDIVTASARAGDVFSRSRSPLRLLICGREAVCWHDRGRRKSLKRSDGISGNKHYSRNHKCRRPKRSRAGARFRQSDSLNCRTATKGASAGVIGIPLLTVSARSEVHH